MLNVRQILVSAVGLALVGVGLIACGQKGDLVQPTDPAAKGRATLPGLLLPDAVTSSPAAQPPAAASSAPAPAPAGGAK
jgi:predicted small lipoprotein YifL